MIACAGTQLAHYRLVEQVGEGGMGVVWRAADTRLGRDVAIKFLPRAFEREQGRLADLEREARAIASLNHPNIVVVYSVEEWEGDRFLTMEFVRGVPLSALIPREGLPFDRFLDLAIPISDAVGAAHERGILHGDLKPANVMVSEEGRVKVLDFGLTISEPREASIDPSNAPTLTDGGAPRYGGTMPYMSPEILQGHTPDHRSDLFSLGVMLYEMATGQRPFSGATPADLVASILRDSPPPVTAVNRGLPHQLGVLIRHCLEKDPRRRIQAAFDLRNELSDLRSGAGAAPADSAAAIGVLPFLDLSPDKDQEYFCDGIAEEIIHALSHLEGLRVASRTSTFQFKRTTFDTTEIGRRLGVARLLEGSVRKAGDRLRISVDLVDVARGCALWSGRYDRTMQDIFAIQEEIAQSVVRALRLTPSQAETNLLGKTATADVMAYDLYLRGRQYFYRYGRTGVVFALQMFRRAIDLDPNYARAHAGLADCHSYLYANSEHSAANREQADAESRRALELDPGSAEAWAARGVALSLNQRDDEAETAFATAIRLDPRLFEARYFYARHSFARGRLDRAVLLYEEAERVRPEDYQSPLLVAQIYDDLGREPAARAARRRGVRIAEDRLMLNPDDVRALYMGANGLVALGERERGLDWARRALALEPEEPMLLYNVACIRSLAGDVEGAIACLEKAVAHGFAFREWVERDSNLHAIRAHPRYLELMRSWPLGDR